MFFTIYFLSLISDKALHWENITEYASCMGFTEGIGNVPVFDFGLYLRCLFAINLNSQRSINKTLLPRYLASSGLYGSNVINLPIIWSNRCVCFFGGYILMFSSQFSVLSAWTLSIANHSLCTYYFDRLVSVVIQHLIFTWWIVWNLMIANYCWNC